MIVIMLGAVFAAVFHADVIAHRVGEPYGTLVLTLAVTIIEVALIESIVLTPGSSPALARDTVFAVVMIVCNGLIGLCIIWGGLRHHEQEYQTSGAGVYLTVLGSPVGPHARSPELHGHDHRAVFFKSAAHFHQRHHRRSLCRFPVHSDITAHRIFSCRCR
jgi:hypothetical protein